MATYKFMSGRKYEFENGHSYEPMATAPDFFRFFGVNGDHWPEEGFEPRMIQGIKVWVTPAAPPRNGRKSSRHRVLCACPGCGKTFSAGRLAQHECKATTPVVQVRPLPRYRVACYANHEMLQAVMFVQFDAAIDQARAWYNRSARAGSVEVHDLETGKREVLFGDLLLL